MDGLTLGGLIGWLETKDPDGVVKDGFGSPHSDRGWYEKLAFEPVAETTFGEMLRHAKSAMGGTFQGYKGGDYKMDEWSDVMIGQWGVPGERITSAHLRLWELGEARNPEDSP